MSIQKTAAVLAAAIAGGYGFLRYYPAFGGNQSADDRAAYRGRAENFAGKQFQYPAAWVTDSGAKDIRLSHKATVPRAKLPVAVPDFDMRTEGAAVTWFGHSGVLLAVCGMQILIDPIFSPRCFPMQWIGPKRFTQPTVSPEDLPQIDLLLLTHDHHDHLDPQTIRALDSRVRQYAVPLGAEKHLLRWGIAAAKIRCLSWWETAEFDGISVTATPTRHFSGRRFIDQNRTLWCGYMLHTDCGQIYVSGDGGFGGHFAEIRKRCGKTDLALMECGQYNSRWHWGHLFPEESVQAAEILGADTAIPVHWGAFVLSDHGWDDPPERFVRAAQKTGIRVMTPHFCETVDTAHPEKAAERWWRSYV